MNDVTHMVVRIWSIYTHVVVGLARSQNKWLHPLTLAMKKISRFIVFVIQFGLINGIHKIRNSRLIHIPVIDSLKPRGSSITDSALMPSYSTMCGMAASDDSTFVEFRKYSVLVQAFDHVSYAQGLGYLSEIKTFGEWKPRYTKVIEEIDAVGNPNKYKFSNFGTFSPTLLRYLKVFLEIESLIAPLKDKSIAEIGVGFGGQASLIDKLSPTSNYIFYDIPPVLELTKKFVTSLGMQGNLEFRDGRVPESCSVDVVISNYAFSEIAKPIQTTYLNNVILKSKSGYITWNNLSANQLGGYLLADLIRLIPNSQIFPEKPYTYDGNVIIVWK